MGRHQQDRRNLKSLIVAAWVCLLGSIPAGAQEKPSTGLQFIPKWAMSATAEGQKACYDKDGAKKLIALDGELVICQAVKAEHTALKGVNAALEKKIESHVRLESALQGQIDILRQQVAAKPPGFGTDTLVMFGVGGLVAGVVVGSVGMLLLTK